MHFLQIPQLDPEKLYLADSIAKATFEQKIESLSKMPMEDIIKTITMGFLEFLWKLALAVIIYYIGRWIINRIKKILKRIFERRGIETTLRTFIINLVSISMYILLIIIIVDILGLNTTSFIAIFASAGLAVGMALSGTMQNFAGGVMLMLLKPYRIGDYIETQGYAGKVKSIQLFNTIINTSDNKTIIIPNGGLSNGTINNYSREPIRRVEWIIGVNYGDDFDEAKTIIKELLDNDERVMKTPAYLIALHELAASSVNIVIRAWVDADLYWDLYFDMNEKLYKTLPEKGIVFPFQQMDVRIIKEK